MKLISRIAITLVLTIAGFYSQAQQDPMYTQYMFNIATINAGAIGRSDNTSLMMVDRFQWVGFEGAPKSMSLTADIPIKFYNSGVGFTYIHDQIGPETSNNLYIDYAYHIKVYKNLKLGMGLKAGFKAYSADFSDVGTPIDEVYANNISGDIMPNFGLGLFLYSDDYYVGLSSPKLVNHKWEGTDKLSGTEERHFFATVGYVLPITNDVVFHPSLVTKMVSNSPVSVDVTANFLFRNLIWAGLGYRSGDALSLLTQIQVSNRFRIGYAYDITLSKLRNASSGSHELMISYEFKSLKEEARSPRYF